MSFSKYEERDCPRCGKQMFCTGDMNCWCLSIEISGKVEDYIAATFDGCLCKDATREGKISILILDAPQGVGLTVCINGDPETLKVNTKDC